MNRSIIFDDLVHPEAGIVLAHEARVRVAAPAHLDDLRGRGFADIPLGAVHGIHPGARGIATVTGHAAETFRGVNIRFVILGGLRQIFYADGKMAGRAGVDLRLAEEDGREN
jgi:hypothetical protein